MKDVVSRWINLVLLSASLLVAGGILLPAFPLSSLAFLAVAASTALWMGCRTTARPTAQVIWDVEAEPVLASPAPKATL